jgi:quercetin dioxygenase-like cupin family protein
LANGKWEESMADISRGSPASYALVAVAAAAVSAAAAWQSGRLVTPLAAQPANPGVTQVLAQPLADVPGREVRISVIDRAPGVGSPPHRHPGHHTFGYVVEGTYEFAVDRQPPRLLKAGDIFYEPPGVVHSTSRNPSAQERLKIIVFMVADQKNPNTVPE